MGSPAAAVPSSPDQVGTLAALLRERGLADQRVLAYRVTLNPRDRSSDFATLDDLLRANVIGLYERLQDGRRFGCGNRVLTFAAEPRGRARLVGFRRFISRRKGVVPGDIVYDYDAAHLLHSFIARARCPVFYDAIDEEGMEDLFGRLVVSWPAPQMRALRSADDPAVTVLER
jgi:hypothetical protein